VLCGSSRFKDAFMKANYEETLKGKMVFSIGFVPSDEAGHGETVGCTPEQKLMLDELHKRKIDEADEVLVLNVEGYIGSSTRSEIDYAEMIGCPIRYLEPLPLPAVTPVIEEVATHCKKCGKEGVSLFDFCSSRCAGMWASSDDCADSLAFCTKVLKKYGEMVCSEVMMTNRDGSRYRSGLFPILF
jgi:hypothetical protein